MTRPDETRPSETRSPDRDPSADWRTADGEVIDEEDRGLVYDVRTLVDRRVALGLFGGVAVTTLLAACSPQTVAVPTASPTATATPTPTAAAAASGPVTEVPDETAGPYPGDGSNGVNVLDDSGIVRRDIRSSFGSSTTTAAGTPLEIRLTVRDAATGAALVGYAVYLWHCTATGGYSLYSSGLEGENYLRGVQETDATGTAVFTSIFPGCYDGRWPHIHFEVYGDVATAVASGPIVKTSQIALPQEACDAVYASGTYGPSASNLTRTSLSSDMVFREDGGLYQLATMSGSASAGYVASLTIGV